MSVQNAHWIKRTSLVGTTRRSTYRSHIGKRVCYTMKGGRNVTMNQVVITISWNVFTNTKMVDV